MVNPDKPVQSSGSTNKAIITTAAYVSDGDTASFKNPAGGQNIVCRLEGIDAPEKKHDAYVDKSGISVKGNPSQPYSEESTQTLKKMIMNKEAKVTVIDTVDKYNRAVCRIEIEGKNISQKMLEEGAAWVHETYNKTAGDRELQAKARQLKLGLWQDPNPEYPPAFKARFK